MHFLTLFLFLSKILSTFSDCPDALPSGLCNNANCDLLLDEKICVSACPSKFSLSQGNKCTYTSPDPAAAALFELEFWKIQDLRETFISSSIDSADKWVNPSGNPYNSITKTAPYPTRNRGFYFSGQSSIASNQNYIPSLYFTAALWILPMQGGEIITAQLGSQKYLELYYNLGILTLAINAANFQAAGEVSKSVQISASILWHFLWVQIEQVDSHTVKASISVNKNSVDFQDSFTSYQANFPYGAYAWTIGLLDSYAFRGFLYWIKSWNSLYFEYNEYDFIGMCSITIYYNKYIVCGTSLNDLSCIFTTGNANDDCTCCYSKQCSTCYGYSEDMCSECASGLEPYCCDWLADTCDSTWNSKSCNSGTVLINGVCLYAIPYGFVNNLPVSTPVINADFTKSFVGIYDNILITGESSSTYNYWKNPESVDPLPAKQRGLYFKPGSYLKAKVNLYHTFSFGMWVYPIAGYYITYTGNQLKVHSDGSIEIMLQDFAGGYHQYTSSINTGLVTWNYISYSIEYDNNGASSITPFSFAIATNSPYTVQEGIFRPIAGGSLSLGSSDFNGFISLFQLWQIAISDFISFRDYFDVNADLWQCDFNCYLDQGTCEHCLYSCQNGCTRAGSCNLCDNEFCLQCSSFGSNSCILCDGFRSGVLCECNSGYYQPIGQTQCSPCYTGCSHCTGSFYYQCISCSSGYYYFSDIGACLSYCPLGYTVPTNECLLEYELVFDLNLNTLDGIIYDKASSIPVVTGSSDQFYPDYENDDPIGVYLRGFYFNGVSSVMRLPEYKTYISPKLQIGPIFTISIWINIENENSSIISKNGIYNDFSTIYEVTLINAKPALQILINNTAFFYSSETSLNSLEWSHLALQVRTDSNGYSVATWYSNTSPSASLTLGYGYFQDVVSNVTSLIGAKQISQITENFFQGFLYEIRIYNKIYTIGLLSQKSCSENCNVCRVTGLCIPTCKLAEFWKGPKYNNCLDCDSSCTNGCKDSGASCNICSSSLCNTCTDYSANGCKICKANASLQNNSCECNNGFNGTTACTYVPFSVNLLVSSDDNLSLDFSDPLQYALTNQSFTILIEGDPEFTWSLEQINTSYYNIPTKIKDIIEKNTVVNVTFFDLTKVKSIYNGILDSSSIVSKLNEYDPTYYSTAVTAITSQATAVVQSAAYASMALSLFNPNPSSLWGLMSSLQILSYLSLSGIPFSKKMSEFISNLSSYNIFPNFFKFLIDEKEGNKAYSEAINFGYNTDLILLNQGVDFSMISTSVFVLPFVVYFADCSYRMIGKKFTNYFKAYKYSFYIRWWIQCYLGLGAASYVGLKVFKAKNAFQISNIIICFGVALLFTASPILFMLFSYKNQLKIRQKSKTFNSLFDSFYYEFRTNNGFFYSLYYFIYFLRRLIYSINLVFLSSYPRAQVAINIACSLLSIIYMLIYWPYKDKIIQISNLITEIMIGAIMCLTSFYIFDMSSSTISYVESCIIFAALIVIGVQFCTSIAIFVRTVYQLLGYRLNHHENLKLRDHSKDSFET